MTACTRLRGNRKHVVILMNARTPTMLSLLSPETTRRALIRGSCWIMFGFRRTLRLATTLASIAAAVATIRHCPRTRHRKQKPPTLFQHAPFYPDSTKTNLTRAACTRGEGEDITIKTNAMVRLERRRPVTTTTTCAKIMQQCIKQLRISLLLKLTAWVKLFTPNKNNVA